MSVRESEGHAFEVGEPGDGAMAKGAMTRQ
jgi:hypothetical protein